MNNDGIRDLDLVVTSAIDADGNDVTSLFQPPFELEVQNELSTFNIYNLQWTGDNGYRVDGLFTFDLNLEGSIITENELEDLQLAFYNPSDELIQVFDYDFPNPDTSGEFNFNFDSATDTILQSGESDTDLGFDLGIDFEAGESGIGFFSGEDDVSGLPPGGTIALTDDNPPNPSEVLDQGGTLSATPRLITYDLSWEGDNGYTMQGLFSYNAGLDGSIITEDDLEDMQLAFFEPDDTLLQVFDYDFPNPDTSGEFNFNFDSATDTVLQSGESDTDMGFDLGIDFEAGESGIGFFSGEDDVSGLPPGGTIALTDDNPPNPSEVLDQGGELIASLAEPFEVSDI